MEIMHISRFQYKYTVTRCVCNRVYDTNVENKIESETNDREMGNFQRSKGPSSQ